MFSLVKSLGLPAALRQEAPALIVAFLIAEVLYKFHSFALECVAFLITWCALSAIQSAVLGRTWRQPPA